MGIIRGDKPPTFLQRQAFLGSLLGDGSLSKPPRGINYHFALYHSAKQKEYLEWKHRLLLPYSRPIQHCFYTDKRDGKTREGYRFHTISHPFFTGLREVLYDGHRKTITAHYLNLIKHPIALAILIGDDGSALNGSKGRACGLHIATKQFNKEENDLLAFWLQSTFGLTRAKTLGGKYFHIGIGVKDIPLLRALILPLLPPEMAYKLGGHDWKPHSWIGKVKTACEFCGQAMEIHASSGQRFHSQSCARKGLGQLPPWYHAKGTPPKL